MNEYLFPTPGSALRELLDFKAKSGTRFTEAEATIDVMLALDRGDLKPQRYLEKRWRWPKTTIQRRLEGLRARAQEWRSFYNTSPHTEVDQKWTKVDQKSRPKGRQ